MKSNTDEYVVKFWIQQPDTYWISKEESYMKNGKNKHKSVEAEFLLTHRKDCVKIISIIYQ